MKCSLNMVLMRIIKMNLINWKPRLQVNKWSRWKNLRLITIYYNNNSSIKKIWKSNNKTIKIKWKKNNKKMLNNIKNNNKIIKIKIWMKCWLDKFNFNTLILNLYK